MLFILCTKKLDGGECGFWSPFAHPGIPALLTWAHRSTSLLMHETVYEIETLIIMAAPPKLMGRLN